MTGWDGMMDAVPHAFAGGVGPRVGGGEAHPRGARGGHGKLPRDGRGDDVSERRMYRRRGRWVFCCFQAGEFENLF